METSLKLLLREIYGSFFPRSVSVDFLHSLLDRPNALDHLTQSGFLKEWKYCYEGGIEITDDEIRAGIINSYEKFISLIIKFELNDFEESKIRSTEIKEKKAEKIKKIKTKPKIKEKTDND